MPLRLHGTLLLLVSVLLSGCYTMRRYPAAPVIVRLVSPSGFQVIQEAGPSRPASSCVALRAEVELTAVRGDTLHFARVTILRQPPEAPPCAHPGVGHVVLTAHPDLRSERRALNGGLTWAAVLASVPLVLSIVYLLVVVGYSGT